MPASLTQTLPYTAGGNYTYGAAVQVAAGVAELINVPPYSTSNDTIIDNTGVTTDGIESFTAVIVAAGSDAVQFQISVDGTDWYWDGAAWATATGYAQSNTAADINTNCAALDLSAGALVKVKAYLHSDDGSTTPQLDSVVFGYSFFVAQPSLPSECIVYGWVVDLEGTPVEDADVEWRNPGYYHGSHFIAGRTVSAVTDVNGYWEISVIETNSIYDSPYNVTVNNVSYGDIQVPNLVSANFKDLIPDEVDNPSGTPDDTDRVAATYNFVIEKGSTFIRTVGLESAPGVPINLTGVTARMQLRKLPHYGDTLLDLTMGSGLAIPTPANGEIVITVDESVTATLNSGGYYDLELVDYPAAGDVKRVLEGEMNLTTEVTR